MPSSIDRVSILGLGLIGGSLGLSWKAQRPDVERIGYDRDAGTCRRAVERGAVDESVDTLEAAVAGADLVVLATPPAAMLRLMAEMSPYLAPGALVTDVGSVKQVVAGQAEEVLPAGSCYVGGHPMAGSEKNGIDHADPFLFQNATYILCPPPGYGDERFAHEHAPLLDLIRATGAQILLMNAARHDRIAAAVSHLPQLLAVVLAQMAGDLHEDDPAVLDLAAGGFRDMTRIASSPFDLWHEVLVANHSAVLDVLAQFAARLGRLRGRLAAEDLGALQTAFDEAHHAREQIPRHTKGYLYPLSDLYVYAEDRPGTLARLTQAVYDAGVNLKDLELLNIPEATGGAFRAGFADPADAQAARKALEAADFPVRRLG